LCGEPLPSRILARVIKANKGKRWIAVKARPNERGYE